MAETLHVTTVRSLSCNRRAGVGKARRLPSSNTVRLARLLDEIERCFETKIARRDVIRSLLLFLEEIGMDSREKIIVNVYFSASIYEYNY